MGQQPSTSIVNEAAIEAALADAEAQIAQVSSLDDDGQRAIVPVQAEFTGQPATRVRSVQVSSPVAVVAAPVEEPPPENAPPPTAPPTRLGWLRSLASRLLRLLRLRRKATAAPSVTEAQGPPSAAATPAEQPPAPAAEPGPRLTPGRVLYRTIDGLLGTVNWPFRWVGPEARQLAGLLAAATIVVSLLAGHYLPRLFPPRDAVAQLHQRVLRPYDKPRPTAPAAAPVPEGE